MPATHPRDDDGFIEISPKLFTEVNLSSQLLVGYLRTAAYLSRRVVEAPDELDHYGDPLIFAWVVLDADDTMHWGNRYRRKGVPWDQRPERIPFWTAELAEQMVAAGLWEDLGQARYRLLGVGAVVRIPRLEGK